MQGDAFPQDIFLMSAQSYSLRGEKEFQEYKFLLQHLSAKCVIRLDFGFLGFGLLEYKRADEGFKLLNKPNQVFDNPKVNCQF